MPDDKLFEAKTELVDHGPFTGCTRVYIKFEDFFLPHGDRDTTPPEDVVSILQDLAQASSRQAEFTKSEASRACIMGPNIAWMLYPYIAAEMKGWATGASRIVPYETMTVYSPHHSAVQR